MPPRSQPEASIRGAAPTAHETGVPVAEWLILGGLISARWWMPVESTLAGETLTLVQLTLFYALFAAWRWARDGVRLQQPALVDKLVWGLVTAHVVSGVAVLMTDGQKRFALNLLWEWIGTGVLWSLIAQTAHRLRFLERLFGTLSIAAFVLAGFGLWQNVIVYPHLRTMLDDFENMEARSGSLSTEERVRFRDLQRSLPAVYLQGDASSRQLFSQRVRDSQEPLGMFALANTFGGFLLVGAWMTWGRLVETYRLRRDRFRLAVWSVGLLLILACLVLTKARTAWAGGAVGLAVWYALTRDPSQRAGAWIPLVALSGTVISVILGVAMLTGRLDLETFRESPKSVRYRLEYWQSTLAMLRDDPVLGPGLGDFRAHYLRHKLPQSSEEILDPHNFVLDIWANAGLLGLLALGGLVAWCLMNTVRPDSPSLTEPLNREGWWLSLGMGQVGVVLAGIVLYLTGSDPIATLGWVIPAWWLAGYLLERTGETTIPRPAIIAAWCSLTVHLLGAGGIESPGVAQLWLLMAAAFVWTPAPVASAMTQPAVPLNWGLTVTTFGLVLACLATATVPVLSAQASLRLGQEQLQFRRNLAAAQKDFEAASQADRFDSESWIQQAFLSEVRWQNGVDDHHFEAAIRQIGEALSRQPHDPFLHRMRGLMWLARYERTHSVADAEEAVSGLREAVARYPHHAGLLADFARTLGPVNEQEAREVALRALAQDDLNGTYGHTDKRLPADVRRRVEALAQGLPLDSAASASKSF